MSDQRWHLAGTHDQLWAALEAARPGVRSEVERVHARVAHFEKREVRDFEAGLLFALAERKNGVGTLFFEIGTCWGWSAAVMAAAAPDALITTCTPRASHVEIARRNLEGTGVLVLEARSVNLLPDILGPFDLIFVDGDHERVADDLPWFDRLIEGGLMLFHDYCPETAWPRPCRPVYDALNDFAARLGREPDVLMTDDRQVGMAGWYRRAGEVWDGLRDSG